MLGQPIGVGVGIGIGVEKKLRFSSNLTIDWGEFPFAQYRSISNFKSMPLWVAPVSVCNEKP